MKPVGLILLLLVFGSTGLLSQDEDFKKIDRYALKAPKAVQANIQVLSEYLIKPAETDLEKARSIYTWITHNISYDKKAYKDGNKRINKSNQDVLIRNTAVCFGYSTLFKEMCQYAGLRSEIISGYSKGTLTSTPELDEPHHAWNAVKLDGQWYLLDATWGSSLINKTNDFVQTFKEGYFLTQPKHFITNHLPADPMWQLLDCPISVEVYQKPASEILEHLNQTERCFNFQDSIQQFLALNDADKKLKEVQNTYHFHPTAGNKKELGHSHFDYASKHADLADRYQAEENFEALIAIQDTIIQHCQIASKHIEFYVWQEEFHINHLINQAVAISKIADQKKDRVHQIQLYEELIELLDEANTRLSSIPDSTFKLHAKESCDTFLEFAQHNLGLLKSEKP